MGFRLWFGVSWRALAVSWVLGCCSSFLGLQIKRLLKDVSETIHPMGCTEMGNAFVRPNWLL